MQDKNTERLKFQDFNICPNILQVNAAADADAIALLHYKVQLHKKTRCICKLLCPGYNKV